MQKLLEVNYWFAVMPGDLNRPFWRTLLILASVCVVIGIASLFMIRAKKHHGVRRRLWVKIAAWSWTVAPVIALLWFFRYQNAYFLSMRFWIVAWIAVSVLWLLFIAKYAFITMPKRLATQEHQDELARYLPHKK